jgi:hypothetical protein
MPDPSEEFYKHKNLSLLRKIQADGLFNNFLGYTHNFCLSQILPKSRLVLSPATRHPPLLLASAAPQIPLNVNN